MKRGKRLIILLLVLALLLGGTFLAGKLNPENQAAEEEEDTSFTLLTLDPQSVTALSWYYSEPVAFTLSSDGWICDADDKFPVDESYLAAILDAFSTITATKTIEAPEDLDQYCLEVPYCTVTITADTTYELAFGEETAMGAERYFSIGDSNVYLVDTSLLNCISYGLYDLIEYESIPDMSDPTSLELTTDEMSYRIEYMANSGLTYSDSYVWFMKNGDSVRALDTELAESFLAIASGVSWDSCADYYADETELAAYGLDAPTAVYTVGYGDTFTLEIGDTVSAGSYARIRGSNMVYLIDSRLCETLLYTTYAELQPDEVLQMDPDTVDSVTVTVDGVDYELMKSTPEETDSEGSTTTTTETVWMLEGTQADFGIILTALNEMESTGYAGGFTPERSQEIRFLFHRSTEAFPEVELVFYQYDSASCLVCLDGVSTVLASRVDVVSIVEGVKEIVSG